MLNCLSMGSELIKRRSSTLEASNWKITYLLELTDCKGLQRILSDSKKFSHRGGRSFRMNFWKNSILESISSGFLQLFKILICETLYLPFPMDSAISASKDSKGLSTCVDRMMRFSLSNSKKVWDIAQNLLSEQTERNQTWL